MRAIERGALASVVATVACCGAFMPQCGAQDRAERQAAERQVQAESFLTASKIIGMPIQVAQDERIGVVHEILIDPVSCEQFVLIDTSGALDLDGIVVMPLPLFEFQTVAVARQPAVLFVNVPIDRIRQAPIVAATDIDLALSATWVNEVNTFFDADLKERRVARPDLNGRDQSDRPGRNDTDEPRPGERPRTPRSDDQPDRTPRTDAPSDDQPDRPRTPRSDTPEDDQPDAPRTPRTPRSETPSADDQPDAPRNPDAPRRGAETPPESSDPQPRDEEPQPRTPGTEENPNP